MQNRSEMRTGKRKKAPLFVPGGKKGDSLKAAIDQDDNCLQFGHWTCLPRVLSGTLAFRWQCGQRTIRDMGEDLKLTGTGTA
jgi:hypothetical protein